MSLPGRTNANAGDPLRRVGRDDDPMSDLYERLSVVGFDQQFVRDRILPDWWDDSLAANPANRAIAELSIARMLGFDVSVLRIPTAPLTLALPQAARLKHAAGADAAKIAPTIRVAERMIRNMTSSLVDLPAFTGEQAPHTIREAILAVAPVVDLGSLLDFAWQAGVVVTRLAYRPSGTGKLHGIAMFCGYLPAVVLTENRDAPPWQAFRLAHELGHIFLGHVRPGEPPILDSDLDIGDPGELDGDHQEAAANAFACELLTGEPDFPVHPYLNRGALALAFWARDRGTRGRIDPGTLLLLHAHMPVKAGVNRYAATERALKTLKQDGGALDAIDRRLAAHLSRDRSETGDQAASLAGVL